VCDSVILPQAGSELTEGILNPSLWLFKDEDDSISSVTDINCRARGGEQALQAL